MPPSNSQADIRALLQQGIQAAREGDRAGASALFQAVLEQDPDQEEAWMWLAALTESPEQSVVYLQRVLAINPHNMRAQAGLQWVRERIEAVEALPEAPIRPAWGGIVNLVSLEPEGTRWKWWYAVGLTAVLLLAGALMWWGTPRILQLVEFGMPGVTATESMPTVSPPATPTPLPPTEAAIATDRPSPLPPTETAMPTAMPSPLPPTVTAIPTWTSSPVPPTATPIPTKTSSPVPPTATAVPTRTSSPVPPTATAIPTATSSPLRPTATPTPTAMSSRVVTPATVWPTPGPTTTPLSTPQPTPLWPR